MNLFLREPLEEMNRLSDYDDKWNYYRPPFYDLIKKMFQAFFDIRFNFG